MTQGISVLTNFDSLLYTTAKPPVVSMYLPTHGPARLQEDRQQLEALIQETKTKLTQEYEHRELTKLDEHLNQVVVHLGEIVHDAENSSIGIFIDDENAYLYMLGYPVAPCVSVDERFYIKPLLKHFQFGAHYFLLGLNTDRFSWIHGDFGSLERVQMPESVKDEFSELFPIVYDGQEAALDYESLENHMPPYHGYKSRNDVRKEEATKFFYYVNRAVNEHLIQDSPLPVILVSLPEHQTLFRSISTIPTLLDEGIEKNVNGIEAPELLVEAKAVIIRERTHRAQKLLELYGDMQPHGGATSELAEIGLALVERKVRALFLAEDAYIPGGFNDQTGEVYLFEREPHGRFQGPELADGFIRSALAQDAEIYELPAHMVPGESGIAALFRYES